MLFGKRNSGGDRTGGSDHAAGPGAGRDAGAGTVRRAAAAFALTVCALFAACIALTVWIDPFFHYHAPVPGFPYVVDNQLSQNPGMARNMIYDGLMTGSSMTVNFDTDDLDAAVGGHAIKLSSNGAYPKDIANVLTFAWEEDSRARRAGGLRHVFVAIDPASFTADPDEVKYPQPDYLYDRDPFDDVSYVLNKDVLLQYVLRPMAEHDPTDLSIVYATTWQTEEYFGRDWVLSGFTRAERPAGQDGALPPDTYVARTNACLDADILPFVTAHPETEFYFFFPPYSILYWDNVIREDRMDATLAQYEMIGELLLAHPNARVFYFQDMEDVVTDLANYSDYEHYSPEINRYMAACFGTGEHEVFPGGMRERLGRMRRIAEDFDYDALFAPDAEEDGQ